MPIRHASRPPGAVLASLIVGVALGVSEARAQTTIVFRDGVSPTSAYAGTRDMAITDAGTGNDTTCDPTQNYDSLDNQIDGDPIHKGTLIRWDLSSLPTNTAVASASMILKATNDSAENYEVYPLLKAWSPTEATWNRASNAVAWQVAGAQGPTDRGASAIAYTPATGVASFTVPFLDGGVAAITGWLQNPASNFGVTIQYYGAQKADSLHFANGQAAAASRPKLHLVFTDGGSADFQNGISPTAGYAGQSDTTIANGPTPLGRWEGPWLFVGQYPLVASLISFDLAGAIPSDAIVRSAALAFHVVTGPSLTIDIRELLKPFSEATVDWGSTDGVTPWAIGGADGAADRGGVVATLPSGAAGDVQLAMNPAGVAMVQGWVNGTRPNRGVRLENFDNGLRVEIPSREWPVATERPGLVIVFEAPDGGFRDAGKPDAGMSDAGTLDAGTSDGGTIARISPAEQSIAPGEIAMLSGSTSSAPAPATITAWRWSVARGPTGVALTAEANQAPRLTAAGTYEFRLVVSDSRGGTSAPASALVHVGTEAPLIDVPVGCGCGAAPPGALSLLGLRWLTRRRRRHPRRPSA